ncbi:unnamed protein product [Effrenium voratum]|nr:unnamed protein product [Effrenium voratum]
MLSYDSFSASDTTVTMTTAQVAAGAPSPPLKLAAKPATLAARPRLRHREMNRAVRALSLALAAAVFVRVLNEDARAELGHESQVPPQTAAHQQAMPAAGDMSFNFSSFGY